MTTVTTDVYNVTLNAAQLKKLREFATQQARSLYRSARTATETADACESEGIMGMASTKRRNAEQLSASAEVWAQIAEACKQTRGTR